MKTIILCLALLAPLAAQQVFPPAGAAAAGATGDVQAKSSTGGLAASGINCVAGTCSIGTTVIDPTLGLTVGSKIGGVTLSTLTGIIQMTAGVPSVATVSSAWSAATPATNTNVGNFLMGNGTVMGFTGTGIVNANQINGTAFAGTSGSVVSFGASNIPADSGIATSTLVKGAAALTTTGAIPFQSGTTGTLTQSANLLFTGTGQLSLIHGNGEGLNIKYVSGNNNISIDSSSIQAYSNTGHTTGSTLSLNGGNDGPVCVGQTNTSCGVTFGVYNGKGVSGSTSILFKEGVAQSTNQVFGIYANNGTTKRIDLTNDIFSVTSTLNIVGASFTWNGKTCTLSGATPSCV